LKVKNFACVGGLHKIDKTCFPFCSLKWKKTKYVSFRNIDGNIS
uniref:RLI domain-containing protein n=1 Tax=Rodentolepis nana TaxID=102285 RepID=A0A0R3TKZ6_RODNA